MLVDKKLKICHIHVTTVTFGSIKVVLNSSTTTVYVPSFHHHPMQLIFAIPDMHRSLWKVQEIDLQKLLALLLSRLHIFCASQMCYIPGYYDSGRNRSYCSVNSRYPFTAGFYFKHDKLLIFLLNDLNY